MENSSQQDPERLLNYLAEFRGQEDSIIKSLNKVLTDLITEEKKQREIIKKADRDLECAEMNLSYVRNRTKVISSLLSDLKEVRDDCPLDVK